MAEEAIDYGAEDLARSLFHIFYGRWPQGDELARAQSVGRLAANPRDALLRHFLLNDEFQKTNRDFYAFFIDQMLRRRVFAGFVVPKINLFCVGTSRAGTTTLARCLERSPDVCLSAVKETNYFSSFSKAVALNGVAEDIYELFFPNWNDQKIIADFTTTYLSSKIAATLIHNYNPEAKIIILLRDPVERALSDFYYLKDAHKAPSIYQFFNDGITNYSENSVESSSWYSAEKMLRRGLYVEDVARYKQLFSSNVKIIEFERFSNLSELLEDVCSFIGVPANRAMFPRAGSEKENSAVREESQLSDLRAILERFYEDDISATQNNYNIKICPWL